VGGIAALNFGSINTSVSNATVSSGPNSVVGSAVGANATFVNFQPGQIPNSSFPSGTTTDSTGTGATIPQVGSTNPQSGLPTFPAIIPPCGDTVCFILNNGQLAAPPVPLPPLLPPDTPLPNVPPLLVPVQKLVIPPTPPPTTQIAALNFNTSNQQPIQINLTTGGTGGTGGPGGTGGNGNNAGNKPPGNPPNVRRPDAASDAPSTSSCSAACRRSAKPASCRRSCCRFPIASRSIG